MRGVPFHAKVARLEYCLPERVESNEQLLQENPDWKLEKIVQKTGITQRYLAAPEQTAADLCVEATEKLFAKAPVDRQEIDALLFCTQSPDFVLPTSACIIQNRLGLPTKTAAFDFNLGCSGFVYGLALAGSMIEAGLSESVLLLCGDTYTKYIDPHDRTCRPIFSDAGTATWIRRSERPLLGPFDLGTDGSGYGNLIVPNRGARAAKNSGSSDTALHMDGASVFMFTMNAVPKNVRGLLAKAGMEPGQVDSFFFHQASRVVLDAIEQNLQLPPEKVVRELEDVGNTVSSTIPIALKRSAEGGRLQPGQRVLLCGFGVGYSWGSCLLEWSGEESRP